VGTNFYWILHPFLCKEWAESITDTNPKRHIGKRSCIGKGKSSFTLSSIRHVEYLTAMCVSGYGDEIAVKDEYEEEYTAYQMLYKEIYKCDKIKILEEEFS
jgi:hypothetical protein